MIARNLLLSFLLQTCLGNCSMAEVLAIENLLKAGKLELFISSLGEHDEECLQVRAKNLSSESLFTRIEPGRIIKSINPDEQDILITQEMIIALAPRGEVTKRAYGFCSQSQNLGPSEGSSYDLGEMSYGPLLAVAKYLNAHREISPLDQQQAVWVMSDCAPISSISQFDQHGDDLAQFVANELGVSKPWYITSHPTSADHLFSRNVDRIRGEMAFEVTGYEKITVIIVNAQGKTVKTLLDSTIYGPGKYDIPLDIFVHHWNQGDYDVHFKGEKSGDLGSYAFTI